MSSPVTALNPAHRAARAADIQLRYAETRAGTLALAAGLSPEDCALQSMPDASPVKWHLAHTSWFFETFVLEPGLPGYRAYDPAFRVLFNSYYVQVGERHPRSERGLISRPALAEVLAYRAHVDQGIARWFGAGARDDALLDLLELGVHHEQQHQELILTDLKHLFSRNPSRPAYRALPARPPAGQPPALEWLSLPSGVYEIGHDGPAFSFDNERPRHRAYLRSFQLASRPVTNAEYLAFLDDGGYERPELWLSDGWDARTAQRWTAPAYWEYDAGAWQVFTLGGMRPLDPCEPLAHVSYYEADAYARWAGARLPTEAEWEALAIRQPIQGNFVESGALHPLPAHGPQAHTQLFGDVWEWTGSAYLGYPGYRPAAGAVGEYNGKFMVNQFVLRGGSCATPRSHVRATYRNFFPPAARWQFSGLRLARDA
jgi:ergothioneine biosynthesis protein EgtB